MMEEFRTPPEISFEPGPGARLRQAREAANRGVGEISAMLHLDPKMVEALETDSFDRLPPPTFVRGYLKGYARLLGLPPGPILEVYDRRGFEPPPLVPDVTEAPQAHTSDLAVRLVTYGIGVMLVMLVALWWHSQDFRGFGILDAGRGLLGWAPESEPAPPDGGRGHDGSTAAGASPGAREGTGSAGDAGPPGSPSAGGAAGGGTAADEPRPSSADGAAAEGMAGAESPSGDVPAVGMVATEETVADESPFGGDSSPEGDAGVGNGPTTVMPSPPSAGGTVTAESSPPSGEDAVAGAAASTEPSPPPTAADTAAVGVAATGPPPSVDGGVAADGATPAPGIAAVPGAGSVIPDREETPAPEEVDGIPLVVAVGPSVPTMESSLLVIEFTNESWVEIYDGHGATLFFDLVPPARVLQVTGTPPFDVLLGNSRDVRVTFDGEPFDHAPYVNRGVAWFSLGAAPEGGSNPRHRDRVPPSPDERRPEAPSG